MKALFCKEQLLGYKLITQVNSPRGPKESLVTPSDEERDTVVCNYEQVRRLKQI